MAPRKSDKPEKDNGSDPMKDMNEILKDAMAASKLKSKAEKSETALAFTVITKLAQPTICFENAISAAPQQLPSKSHFFSHCFQAIATMS